MDVSKYAKLADEILFEQTGYLNSKNIIKNNFIFGMADKNEVTKRLTIIDAYYSTQMNKRVFGIEEIAETIIEISNKDEEIKEYFLEFLENPIEESNIYKLFDKEYGYDKKGNKFGKAISLISKYAYFICDYKFPIYDSLVKKYQPILLKKLDISKNYLLRMPNDDDIIKYLKIINDTNTKLTINDFDKLDSLLWLYGKLYSGSLSLLLNKDKFLIITKYLEIPNDLDSDKINEYISQRLKDYKNDKELQNILGNKVIKFLEFMY